MDESASLRSGYTLSLAGRHLATGLFRPRSAMREALAAGLDERRRVLLFVTSLWLSLLLEGTVRAGLANYLGVVRDSQAVSLYALGAIIILTLMFLMAWLIYAIGCVVLHGAVLIVLRPRRLFATTRSVVALGAWITTGPIGIIAAFGLPIFSFPALPLETWVVAVALAPIVFAYCSACVAEAFGSSSVRSAVVALLAVAGGTVAQEGVDRGLDRLVEIVRGLNAEHHPA